MFIFIICTVAWFALGFMYAPRAAAHGYSNCPYDYESMRKDSAKIWYWFTMFLGPLVIATMFFYNYVVKPAGQNTQSRLDSALIKHDDGYRKHYFDEQERRIAKLQLQNDRLTKDILR